VQQLKHAEIRADAERQRQNYDEREAWRAPQLPEGVTQIQLKFVASPDHGIVRHLICSPIYCSVCRFESYSICFLSSDP
jgi:hypothetical protein